VVSKQKAVAFHGEQKSSWLVLRQVIDSSSLRSIGYDRASHTLEVEFRSGGIYRYADVPDSVWFELRHAESKGRFFQERVRDHFAAQRLP
jgi:hypothetical protein